MVRVFGWYGCSGGPGSIVSDHEKGGPDTEAFRATILWKNLDSVLG